MSVQPWRPDRDLATQFHDGSVQMWRCIECRAERQWGYGRPEVNAPAFLTCLGDCHGHTKHVFSRVSA